jgi:outer membrane protein
MTIKKQLLTLFFLSSLSATAFSENLFQVFQHAQKNDAQLRASESAYWAMLERRPQALSALEPKVNLSGSGSYTLQNTSRSRFRHDSRSATLNLGYKLNLTKSIYNKSFNAQIDQADAAILQARASFEADMQDLILRVAEAYLSYLKAKDSANFSKSETTAIGKQLQQVKVYFHAGRSAITDVKEAQARYDQARAQEVAAVHQVQLAKESLKAISGMYYNNLLGASENIPLLSPRPDSIVAWSKTAVNNSKLVRIAEQGVIVAQANVDIARTGKSPTVDIFASHSGSSSFGKPGLGQDRFDAAVGLQVNIPLSDGGNTASRVREARHKLQQSRYLLEAQRRAVIQEARAAFLSTASGLAQLQALKQALLSNQTAAAATRTGFQVGTRTAVDVLLALRETFRSQRDYSSARYDFLLNTLKLKKAAGTLRLADLRAMSALLARPRSASARVAKYKP